MDQFIHYLKTIFRKDTGRTGGVIEVILGFTIGRQFENIPHFFVMVTVMTCGLLSDTFQIRVFALVWKSFVE